MTEPDQGDRSEERRHEDRGRDERHDQRRHEDRGRSARQDPPRRVKTEHVTIGSVLALLVSLPVGGKFLSNQVDSQNAALLTELKAQGAQLADLKLSVARLEGQVTSSDKMREVVFGDLARRVKALEDERHGGGK